MRLLHSTITSVLLIAYLTWSGGMACAQTVELQGGIEHSEFVAPLDGFRVGAQFDQNLLPGSEEGEGSWWPVPKWLAGEWHKTGRIEVLSFTDLKTKEQVRSKKRIHVHYPDNEVLGHQTDGHDQVWSYVPLPCVMKTSSGDKTNVNVVRSFNVVDETKDSITVKLFLFTLVVNESNNKVISICQRECLQTWTPVRDDMVSILESTKFFDRNGEANYSKTTQTYSQKCKGYCPVNFVNRTTNRPVRWQSYSLPTELRNSRYVPLDLRDSLAEFLRTHNLTSRHRKAPSFRSGM